MSGPLRIAILECDEPVPSVKEKFGGYGHIFTTLLKAGADAYDQPDVISSKHGLVTEAFEVVTKQEYPNLDDFDAVLLTGSKFNAHDDDEWILKLVEFTKKVLNQDRVRVIGVCYGHQIIARALGTKTGRSDLGWEVSVCPVVLTERGQDLFGKELLSIHQMHQDAVYEYPPGVEHLGHSPRAKVQGIYQTDRLITVQGHPEFNQFIMEELLKGRHEKGILNDEIFEDGMNRVANHHDGVAVSKAFIKFLLENRAE